MNVTAISKPNNLLGNLIEEEQRQNNNCNCQQQEVESRWDMIATLVAGTMHWSEMKQEKDVCRNQRKSMGIFFLFLFPFFPPETERVIDWCRNEASDSWIQKQGKWYFDAETKHGAEMKTGTVWCRNEASDSLMQKESRGQLGEETKQLIAWC